MAIAPQQGGKLDGPPPPPPGTQGAPSSNLQSMAGQRPPTPGAGGGVQQSVIEKLMLVEKTLRDAAGIMPDLSPIVDDVVSRLRQGAGRLLVQSSQGGGQAGASPQPPPGAPPAEGVAQQPTT